MMDCRPANCCSFQLHKTSQEEAYKALKFPKRRPQLLSIDESREHRLTLEDWTEQLKASSSNLARKQSRCNTSRSDLYQILALFFVFQGVVLTAIAQASALTCSKWPLVFALSAIASVASIGASVQKLKEVAETKEQCILEKSVYSSLSNAIELLKERGSEFDLEAHQPELRATYAKKDQTTGSGNIACWGTNLANFLRVWVLSYAGAVLFLLLAFSGVTLVSVRLIVCDPQR